MVVYPGGCFLLVKEKLSIQYLCIKPYRVSVGAFRRGHMLYKEVGLLYYTGCTYIAQHYTKFLCVLHQHSLFTGPVRSSASLAPWGAYSPAAIMALVTIQAHKQSLSNQVPIHSWVERMHMHTSDELYPKTQHHTAAAEIRTQDLTVVSHRPWSLRHNAQHVYGAYKLDVETLGGGHCQGTCRPHSFFTFHSMSVRQHRHLRGHASHERYTVSTVEGREINLHRPLPRVTGAELEVAARQACATMCANAPFCIHRESGPIEETRRAAYRRVGNTEIYALVQMDSGAAQSSPSKVSWKYMNFWMLDAPDIPVGPIKPFIVAFNVNKIYCDAPQCDTTHRIASDAVRMQLWPIRLFD